MPSAGGAMTQTFYRLFGYALLDNRTDDNQDAVARVNYRIDLAILSSAVSHVTSGNPSRLFVISMNKKRSLQDNN